MSDQRSEAEGMVSSDQRSSEVSGAYPVHCPLAGTRCLVAEDNAIFASAEKRFLERLGATVTVVEDVTVALRALRALAWDLVIVDLGLPDGRGEIIVEHAVTVTPRPGVVVVSGILVPHPPARLHGLGAFVVHKNVYADQIAATAQAALLDARGSGSPALPAASDEIPMGSTVRAFALRHQLSPKQGCMLALLAARRSNKQIATELGITEETVRVQWGRVLTKLGLQAASKSRESVLLEFANYCAENRR